MKSPWRRLGQSKTNPGSWRNLKPTEENRLQLGRLTSLEPSMKTKKAESLKTFGHF
jgi:hypothetical protein